MLDPSALMDYLASLTDKNGVVNVGVRVPPGYAIDGPLQIISAVDNSNFFSPFYMRFNDKCVMRYDEAVVHKVGRRSKQEKALPSPKQIAIVALADALSENALGEMTSFIGTLATCAILWIYIDSFKGKVAREFFLETSTLPFLIAGDPLSVKMEHEVLFYATWKWSQMMPGNNADVQEITINDVPASEWLSIPDSVYQVVAKDANGVDSFIFAGSPIILFRPKLIRDDIADRMPCICLCVTVNYMVLWTASGSILSISINSDNPPFIAGNVIPSSILYLLNGGCAPFFAFKVLGESSYNVPGINWVN